MVADAAAAVECHGILGQRRLDQRADLVAQIATAPINPDFCERPILGPELLHQLQTEVFILLLGDVGLAGKERRRRPHIVCRGIQIEVVSQRKIESVAQASLARGGDKVLEHGQVGGDVVAVGRAIRQRHAGLPGEEPAAVLGGEHGRGHAHRLEALNPVADVEVARLEGGDVRRVAAAVAVAAQPVLRIAAGVAVVEKRRHAEVDERVHGALRAHGWACGVDM